MMKLTRRRYRWLAMSLILSCPLSLQAGVFAEDQQASAYPHDRIGKLAGATLLRVCGESGGQDNAATHDPLRQWQTSPETQAAGVTVKRHEHFAGEHGLTAQFRISRDSCVLTLSPYRANARAGDELAYGVSEAAGKLFGDAQNNWQPEQAMSGLHRIDPAGFQYQQTFYLQWQTQGGAPKQTYFALFDSHPDNPRVLLGKRTFSGQVMFGMADSQWQAKQTPSGKAIVSIRSTDPVDTQAGGYNVVSLSKTGANRYTLKAWLPIGDRKPPFRIQRSLGDAPVTGFKALNVASAHGNHLTIKSVEAQPIAAIPGKTTLLNKGLYPVYLSLDGDALSALTAAEYFTLVLTRQGGSEIHLQLPAGTAFGDLIQQHLVKPAR